MWLSASLAVPSARNSGLESTAKLGPSRFRRCAPAGRQGMGTFGPKRYTLLATRSSGHSLPIVNGHEQASGRESAAQVLVVEAGPSLMRVQLDLHGAYPAAAGHQRLLRTITLESVLMSATDQLKVLGLEPLEHCVLHRVEPHHFRDNRGEESCAWRWYWTPSTAEPSTEADAALQVGYRISPKLKHGVDRGVANGANRP